MAFSQAQPDLILVDVDNPGAGGIEFIQELKSSDPGVRVIVISALADAQPIRQAVESGCDSYLIKPFSAFQCRASVQWILERMGACLSAGTSPLRPEGPCARQRTGGCPRLSERECSVLQCLARGLLYKEIACQFNLSVTLVKKVVHGILMSLGADNRTEAGLQWLICGSCARRQLRLPQEGAQALPNAAVAASRRG
jgi:DNA-binding NarL/FixJ family response regulator